MFFMTLLGTKQLSARYSLVIFLKHVAYKDNYYTKMYDALTIKSIIIFLLI